jgi:hypothetical protein
VALIPSAGGTRGTRLFRRDRAPAADYSENEASVRRAIGMQPFLTAPLTLLALSPSLEEQLAYARQDCGQDRRTRRCLPARGARARRADPARLSICGLPLASCRLSDRALQNRDPYRPAPIPINYLGYPGTKRPTLSTTS